jgi:S-DNA-T family DNA segregation ATPase FtsK/SpoIIIE
MFNKKDTPLTKSGGAIDKMRDIIIATFADFNVPVEMLEVIDGYREYHFYLQPKQPVRMKVIAGFLDDLRYALSCDDVEILAPVPNKKYIGITVPKSGPLVPVNIEDVLHSKELLQSSPLTVPVGFDEESETHSIDLARMPHLLVAGVTGSGKSVLMHSLINALIEKNSPEQLRLILCDPKRVEMVQYAKLPHLLTPVITDAKKTVRALSWAIKEVERRYDILQSEGLSDISSYHKKVYQPAKIQWEKAGEKQSEADALPESVPYIVIVIDEISDFMQAYPREVESILVRLTQMSRAVGVHLVITTQRPTASVITSSVSAGLPSRIAMSVTSYVDSRVIIGVNGAEKLRGEGDMLLVVAGEQKPIRLQGYFISEEDVAKRVKEWIALDEGMLDALDLNEGNEASSMFGTLSADGNEDDELYEDAKVAVLRAGKASTSYLQRSLRIGYSRAARLMDLLEEGGVIGPQDGSRPRDVLADND